MAGEVYGSPGAAFSGALEGFLLDQEKLKHQRLVDSIATQREKHQEEIDKLDMAQRQQELDNRVKMEGRLQRKSDVEELHTNLADTAPGDILDPSLVKEGQRLGVPVRMGPIPQKQSMAEPPPALAEQPSPDASIANTPMSPDVGRTYRGSAQQEAGQKLLETLQPGSPERTAVEYELATGKGIPAGVFRTAPTPRDLTQYSAFGKDGKEIPGVVQTDSTGKLLFNGGQLPEGATVKRTPTPVDPTLEAIRAMTLSQKRQEQSQSNAPIVEGTPQYRRAQDLAAGKMSLEEFMRFYSFQRNGREEARKVYDLASQLNPNLSPMTMGVELSAYKGALTKLEGQKSAVDSYATAANLNSQTLEKLLPKIPDTGFAGKPNDWVRAANSFLGSEEQASFNGLMTSLQSEYNRLISNPNLTGVVTDSTREEMRNILDKGGTIGQIRALLATLKQESANRAAGIDSAIKNVHGEIGDVAHQPKSADSPTKKSLDDLWKEANGGK